MQGILIVLTRERPRPTITREAHVKTAWRRHLVAKPGICGGQMCARGTRVPVAVILDSLAEGASVIDVLRSYPTLKPSHVRAAVAYAAQLVREEQLTPLLGGHANKARREPSRRVG
jgi:uncharacterized protein (DUF433 family)